MTVGSSASIIPRPLHRLTRRHTLAALTVAALSMRSHSQEMQAAGMLSGTPLVEGATFVGRTSDPATYIAVIVGEPLAMAYLCDGPAHQFDTWFSGLPASDHLTLNAADGAQLVATRSLVDISGHATLHDGRELTFTAQPASGLAGVYALRLHGDGTIRGSSSTRGVIAGQPMSLRSDAALLASLSSLMAAPERDADQAQRPDGEWFAARITLSDGESVPVTLWTATADPGHFWLILLSNGDSRGQGVSDATGAWFDPRFVVAT